MKIESEIVRKTVFVLLLFVAACVLKMWLIGLSSLKNTGKDEWHYANGSAVACRTIGCKKKPIYSNWNDRFCSEHLNKSINHSNEYNSLIAKKKINTQKALSKEEADALRGTGYHHTRPNSSAEDIELKAAMVKCINCGMHSHNGINSLCYECQYNKDYGLD